MLPFFKKKKIEARVDSATLTVSLIPGGELRVWSVNLAQDTPVAFSAAGAALIMIANGRREEIAVFENDADAEKALRHLARALMVGARPTTGAARLWHFAKMALVVFALLVLFIMWSKPAPHQAQDDMRPPSAVGAPAGVPVPADQLLGP